MARDLADDEPGAIEALQQAVSLAPEYAEPRWQLGNVLFRAGRIEESFIEMRRAALSDPSLLSGLIDLAWGASGGDTAAVMEVLNPESASWKIALAKFFTKHGKIPEAVALFRAAGGISEEERKALLNELLAARRYHEAYEVWANTVEPSRHEERKGIATVNDGGFEGKLMRNEPGFAWQLTNDAKTLRISLDQREPHSSAQSLRIDFNGDANPGLAILTQLILVEPKTSYKLHFAARTEEIVSGGLPLLEVTDTSSPQTRVLAQSEPLAPDSRVWREYTLDFTTAETTDAVYISFHRQNCGAPQCPIFGRVWLDDFAIEKR